MGYYKEVYVRIRDCKRWIGDSLGWQELYGMGWSDGICYVMAENGIGQYEMLGYGMDGRTLYGAVGNIMGW